jgi:hypothetical protein
MDPLYFFWGQAKMPYLRYATLETACRIHPDVRLIVREELPIVQRDWWGAIENEEKCGVPGTDWMPKVKDLPVKIVAIEDFSPEVSAIKASGVATGDLLKWWTLANVGGHVADMDIAWIRPIPTIESEVEAVVWPESYGIGKTPMGLIQGRPCDWWKQIYARARALYQPLDYFSCGATNVGFEMPPDGRVLDRFLINPWAGTLPFGKWHRPNFEDQSWPEIPEACCGLHWFAGANQNFVRAINGPDDLKAGAVAWAITGWTP